MSFQRVEKSVCHAGDYYPDTQVPILKSQGGTSILDKCIHTGLLVKLENICQLEMIGSEENKTGLTRWLSR